MEIQKLVVNIVPNILFLIYFYVVASSLLKYKTINNVEISRKKASYLQWLIFFVHGLIWFTPGTIFLKPTGENSYCQVAFLSAHENEHEHEITFSILTQIFCLFSINIAFKLINSSLIN